MLVEPRDEYLFIGLPRRARNEALGIALELLYERQLPSRLFNLQHAVETGVAHHGHVMDANGVQQFTADVVLHIEPGEALQHVGILTTIPAEEHLSGTEDAADAVDGNAPVLQDVQVVVPELVLDEERHHGTDGAQEATGIGNGVKGQVADDVGTLIVFAYLVA